MSKLLSSLSRKQKTYVFLAIDLALVPVALFFTYAVQALPMSPGAAMWQSLPVLPYMLGFVAALSLWLGLPRVQLIAYEGHAVGQTAVIAIGLVAVSAGLSVFTQMRLPLGTHVMFGICYFLFVAASRVVLLQVVTAMYRRAQPRRRVLI